MVYRRKCLSARGFTMIEMLVVIAIIIVLVGLAITGFQALERGTTDRRTKVMLGNAASMLAEYEAATALRRQPAEMWPPIGTAKVPATDIWRDNDPGTAGNQRLTAPGNVEPEEPTDRVGNAVRNTAVVLQQMSQVPGVKTMFGQISAESTMKVQTTNPDGSVTVHEPAPVLLDGWGNPIIFVPAAGMDVTFDPDTAGGLRVQFVVTSVKNYTPVQLPALPAGTLAPGARPFFASAGPDGNFLQGDDNVYSFQN